MSAQVLLFLRVVYLSASVEASVWYCIPHEVCRSLCFNTGCEFTIIYLRIRWCLI